jgi:phage-related protein
MNIKFFCNANGTEPVRKWLKNLELIERREIGNDLQTVQLGWKKGVIGEPLVKSLGDGLFEVRTPLSNHKNARVLFCLHENFIVLLHAFMKKTQKTPSSELALARKRRKCVQDFG